ncbi:MAG TPA: SprT family zinc-dependent metalloprotease [Bauldia sp.]|nr:SprT family zinc-dependent metalloprotease [Bauldia sp.]
MPLFRTPPPEQFEIATESGLVAVKLRRHPGARNYTLRLKSATGTPVLTMPMRGSLRQARNFLDHHAGWLLRQIDKLPRGVPIVDGGTIPLRGVAHRIRHAPGRRGTAVLVDEDGAPAIVVAGAAAHLRRRVVDFMKREAKRDLEPLVTKHAARLGVAASAIRLRDQTSRWGSCTASGRLSFSWRLVMAPPFVLDYLAAHEVAHLREMNHSQRFWRLVEMLCPHTRQARAWLNAEGARLHAVGAADRPQP